MAAKHRFTIGLLVSLLGASLLACNVLPTVVDQSTPVASSNSNASQNTPILNVWNKVAPGVALRYEDWKSPDNNEDTVTIVRLDLQTVHLQVGYQPSQPAFISDWMQQEHATVVINGGYFDAQDNAEGLVVSDGHTYGTSYSGFGGMLAVNGQGNVSLRSLRTQPYASGEEQLQQAIQSSPMLVVAGKRTQFQANAASQRRSVVAMDTQGHLLLIVSPGQAFSLDELADLLVSSDLSIQTALNFDGGGSTALSVKDHVNIDSIVNLPLVLIVQS